MISRIVYLSWPAGEITGGIKMAFRHVEALREANFDAVIATADAKAPWWFQSSAPVINLTAVARGEDVLVFPENNQALLQAFAGWPNRKLVFCQNWLMATRGLGGCSDFADLGVSEVLCVDPYTAKYCQSRFPTLLVAIIPVCIDHQQFRFQSQKKLQIAFSPRKRPIEATFIRDLFRARNPEFRSIPWIKLKAASETQMAETLRETAVYLSLCRFESCPLTIMEAMACGCMSAGFTGLGGRQYTTARNGFWADEDDCIQCADQLTQAVRLVTEGGPRCSDMLEAAHVTAKYYSRERMARGVVEFWTARVRLGRK